MIAPVLGRLMGVFEQFVALQQGSVKGAESGFVLGIQPRQHTIQKIPPPRWRGGNKS